MHFPDNEADPVLPSWKLPFAIAAGVGSLIVGLHLVIQLTVLVGSSTSWFFGLLAFLFGLASLVGAFFATANNVQKYLLSKDRQKAEAITKAEALRFSVNKAGVARDNNPRKAGL